MLPGSNLRVALTPLQLSLFLFLQYLSRLLQGLILLIYNRNLLLQTLRCRGMMELLELLSQSLNIQLWLLGLAFERQYDKLDRKVTKMP